MSSTFQAGSEKSTACLAEKQLWFTQSAHLESNLIQHWQPGCILFGGRCGKPTALPSAMARRGLRISGNPVPFQVPRWWRVPGNSESPPQASCKTPRWGIGRRSLLQPSRKIFSRSPKNFDKAVSLANVPFQKQLSTGRCLYIYTYHYLSI